MDQTLEEACSIRGLGDGLTARIETTNAIIAQLEAEYSVLDKENETVLRDNDRMKHQCAILDEEIELLQAHIKGQNEQITLLEETVRPQLLNELKRLKDEVELKRIKYDALIEKYDKIWEEYEAKYNQFPRVAEKNALEVKAKLLKIEVMKKQQEVLEKREQVKQLRDIQARQLEISRNAFLESYTRQQEARQKYEAIQKQIREMKERIALKKLKKQEEQEKLEEERRRKLKEDELQQQASNTPSEENESTQGANSSLLPKTFCIPNFTMPKFDDLLWMPSRASPIIPEGFKSLSQGTGLTTIENKAHNSISQMMSLSQTFSPMGSLGQIPDTSATLLKIQRKGVETKESSSPHLSVRNVQRMNSSDMNSNPCLETTEDECFGVVSSTNKKEFMISTDNMIAKIKCAARNNNTMSPASTVQFDSAKNPVGSSKNQILSSTTELSIAQRLPVNQEVIQPRCYSESMEIDQPEDESHLKKINQETSKIEGHEKQYERSESSNSSIDLCSNNTDENLNQLSDDQAYGCNTDFAEEMYSSLGSPPPFDGNVMSPAHAGFDSPPTLSIDENQKDDEANEMPFTGFGFFPTTSNIFGGPSSSAKTENEPSKSAASFSFMF